MKAKKKYLSIVTPVIYGEMSEQDRRNDRLSKKLCPSCAASGLSQKTHTIVTERGVLKYTECVCGYVTEKTRRRLRNIVRVRR